MTEEGKETTNTESKKSGREGTKHENFGQEDTRKISINDNIQLMQYLKWNTDEEHQLTQKKLREGAGELMGYKSTFRRRLQVIANNCPVMVPSPKKSGTVKKEKEKTGIYYRHEITKEELHFLVEEIENHFLFSAEKKKSLKKRLIGQIGSKFFEEREKMGHAVTSEYSTTIPCNMEENLSFLRQAICEKKMISFRKRILNQHGELVNETGKEYMVSPYRVVRCRGEYWLLGNERLSKMTYAKQFGVQYSGNLSVFRVDKLTNLKIAKKENEKKAHYFQNTEELLPIFEKMCIYKEGVEVPAKDIKTVRSEYRFVVLWGKQKKDYTFLRDTFGSYYTVEKEEAAKSIILVHSSEECFLDFALVNLDRIKLSDSDNCKVIKGKIRNKMIIGLRNHNLPDDYQSDLSDCTDKITRQKS